MLTAMENELSEDIQQSLQDKLHHLDSIIAVLPGHVYWLDINNTFQGCNELQAKMVNLSSRYDIIGKRNQDLFCKEQAEKLDQVNLRVLGTGEPYIGEEAADSTQGMGIYLSQKVPLTDRKRM